MFTFGTLTIPRSFMPAATGGTITYSGGKTIHTFTTSGNFVVNTSLTVDYLVVGGGGGGALNSSGGG